MGREAEKEYILDRDGNKIYDTKKCQYKFIPATNWSEQTKAEEWRAAWADCVSFALGRINHSEQIDHRFHVQQTKTHPATILLSVAAF